MNKTDVVRFYDYGYWATAIIVDKAEKLTDEQYMTEVPGISHGSTHATLAHMLGAEAIWRIRCFEGESPTRMISAQDFADIESLRAYWAIEELKMRAALDLLTEDSLDRLVRYSNTKGREGVFRLGDILYHLFVHGIQHRSEAAAALTYFSHSPGDVDMIKYLQV